MATYVFSKWPSAAILAFQSKSNLKAFLLLGRLCLWTKFRVNVCTCDWVMAIKVNFQNGACRHLGFCRKWNLTTRPVAAEPYLSPHQIWWRYLEGRSTGLPWIWNFPSISISISTDFCVDIHGYIHIHRCLSCVHVATKFPQSTAGAKTKTQTFAF